MPEALDAATMIEAAQQAAASGDYVTAERVVSRNSGDTLA
jgi:hypothetical protein